MKRIIEKDEIEDNAWTSPFSSVLFFFSNNKMNFLIKITNTGDSWLVD